MHGVGEGGPVQSGSLSHRVVKIPGPPRRKLFPDRQYWFVESVGMPPSILSLKGKPGTRLGIHRKILSGPHAQVCSAGLRDSMDRNLPLLSRFDTYRQ